MSFIQILMPLIYEANFLDSIVQMENFDCPIIRSQSQPQFPPECPLEFRLAQAV
jgi:hypothetical protein